MRISIISVGSQGDVQPYVALAIGLKASGHQVRLVTHAIFSEFVRQWGIDFAPLPGSPAECIAYWNKLRQETRNPLRRVTRINRFMMEPILEPSWQACQDAEAIIYTPLAMSAYHIAEKLGVPAIPSSPQPFTPTRAFPNPLLSNPAFTEPLRVGKTVTRMTGARNWFTYSAYQQVFWQTMREPINKWRAESLKLPPMSFRGPSCMKHANRLPHLYCHSTAMLPRPDDWPAWIHVTGFWFLERHPGWKPAQSLLDFLSSGPPPVFVTLGSMKAEDKRSLSEKALSALEMTGQRAIFLGMDSIPGDRPLPRGMIVVDSVPFDWLFPQVSAVVQHGGIGTITAALRAGVPFVCIPSIADQSFWARRAAELGVALPPITHKELTAERLASAIKMLLNDRQMKDRIRDLGERISSENGVANAVGIINFHLSSRVPKMVLLPGKYSQKASPVPIRAY